MRVGWCLLRHTTLLSNFICFLVNRCACQPYQIRSHSMYSPNTRNKDYIQWSRYSQQRTGIENSSALHKYTHTTHNNRQIAQVCVILFVYPCILSSTQKRYAQTIPNDCYIDYTTVRYQAYPNQPQKRRSMETSNNIINIKRYRVPSTTKTNQFQEPVTRLFTENHLEKRVNLHVIFSSGSKRCNGKLKNSASRCFIAFVASFHRARYGKQVVTIVTCTKLKYYLIRIN